MRPGIQNFGCGFWARWSVILSSDLGTGDQDLDHLHLVWLILSIRRVMDSTSIVMRCVRLFLRRLFVGQNSKVSSSSNEEETDFDGHFATGAVLTALDLMNF